MMNEILLKLARVGEYRCESVVISGLLAETQISMVSSCPPDYRDTQTAERCSRLSHRADYNYLSDIPVTSLNTGHVYR